MGDLTVVFESREDAGVKLARWLKERGVQAQLVLGLPRGGVIVAAAVAHALRLPLDVLIVRKIGHPLQREFAVGALAEGDVVVLPERGADLGRNLRSELQHVIEEERVRLQTYQQRFHHATGARVAGRDILLVDDGLATGATTEAAVLSARKQGASQVIVAAPVGSASAVKRLAAIADRLEVMFVDPDFDAVGCYYTSFPQTTDEEVLEALVAV